MFLTINLKLSALGKVQDLFQLSNLNWFSLQLSYVIQLQSALIYTLKQNKAKVMYI